MIEFFDAKEYIPSFNRTLHGQEFQRQGLQHAESNGSLRKRIEAFRHCKKAKNQFCSEPETCHRTPQNRKDDNIKSYFRNCRGKTSQTKCRPGKAGK